MIVASLLMSRCTFLGALASSSFGALFVEHNSIDPQQLLPPEPQLELLPSLTTSSSFVLPNIRNAPQSSSVLTDEEHEAMISLASRIVRDSTAEILRADPTLAGSLLRLAFHDAATREAQDSDTTGGPATSTTKFTGGSNGSVRYELEWSENRGLSRPLGVVENIHDKVAGLDMSFADCIALAGAAAVEYAGGPRMSIKLGRIDATTADPRIRRRKLKMDTDRSMVDMTLPSAGLDSDGLRLYFGALGLTEEELVALSGSHDLGRHVTLLDMPKNCLKNLTRTCLEDAPVSVPFVTQDPDRISNKYFQKLLKWYDRKVELGEVAFIPTDVALVVDEGLRIHVQKFARDEKAFFAAFVSAYQKLVDATATSAERY